MDQRQAGLFGKYRVSRMDGKDWPGSPKADAEYFVLDYVYDKYAREALKYYAFVCQEEFPQLSQDLWLTLRDVKYKGEDEVATDQQGR